MHLPFIILFALVILTQKIFVGFCKNIKHCWVKSIECQVRGSMRQGTHCSWVWRVWMLELECALSCPPILSPPNVVLPTGILGQGKHIMHGMVYHMVPKPSSIIFPCFECPVENTICRLFPIKTLLVSRCGNPPLICHSYRLSGDQGKYAKNED